MQPELFMNEANKKRLSSIVELVQQLIRLEVEDRTQTLSAQVSALQSQVRPLGVKPPAKKRPPSGPKTGKRTRPGSR